MKRPKKISRPGHVDVLHKRYAVVWRDEKWADGNEAWGMCTHSKGTIEVCEEMTIEKQAEVLLHEVLHAIYDVMGLNNGKKLGQEKVVTQMAVGVMTVWRQNPHVVAWIEQAMEGAR